MARRGRHLARGLTARRPSIGDRPGSDPQLTPEPVTAPAPPTLPHIDGHAGRAGDLEWALLRCGIGQPGDCPMTGSGSAFVGFRFPPEVIAVAVRWYLRYGLSYRDVEELLAERGVTVDHVTGHCCIERSRECLAVNLAARRRSTSAGRLLCDDLGGPDGAVWDVSRGADRKICCAGLTRWLNATVPLEVLRASAAQVRHPSS